MNFATKLIHAAYDPDDHNRAIMPPIYQNSMFALHEIGEDIPFRYARIANPTRKILEDTIAILEQGTHGFAFASGMAGMDVILRTLLRPNDTVVAGADIYGGSYDLLMKVYAPWGVRVIFVDLTQPENLDAILAMHKIRLLWLETPSNPLLRLVDIKQLAKKAAAAGALVAIDNTFATPYLQNPLAMGCDIVLHSATKYLCGHSDVLLGVAAVKDDKLAQALQATLMTTGAVAAPMDCWLVLRGIKTLMVRMKQHNENAQILAQRLQQHPAIAQVFYPGLPSHKQHDLAKQQMRGFGGVVSICLKNNSQAAAGNVIKKLTMVQMAASLGGVESLVNHCYTQSHSGMPAQLKQQHGIVPGLLRFSVGIEDIEDIYNDIAQALQ